jgi:YVTN family beta-propeller protein
MVDTTTNTVTARIPVGSNHITEAITQNSQRVYVTNLNSNDVSVIDVSSDAQSQLLPVLSGQRPSLFGRRRKTILHKMPTINNCF